MSARGRTVAAAALATVGGLAVAAGSSGAWLTRSVTRDVGGVVLTEPVSQAGTELVPALFAVGVAAVVGGLLLVVVPGVARVIVAVVVVLLGAAALALTGAGTVAALDVPGALTAGPGIAAVGALGALGGGGLALRAGRGRGADARLPARFSIDQPSDDAEPSDEPSSEADEWTLSSADRDEDAGRGVTQPYGG